MKTATFRQMLAAGAMLLAGPAVAGSPIDETRPVSPDVSLSVKNVSGSITVTGWDRDEVRVTGELGEGVEELAIEGGGDRLVIEVRYPDDRRDREVEETELEVMMPRGGRLDAEGVSADVSASGLAGPVRMSSVSGDLKADLDGDARVRLESTSGDVELSGRTGGAELETISGDIRAEALAGQVRLKTVSGDADLEADTLERLDMESVSGDLTAAFALAPGGGVRAKSLSGDVTLELPAGLSARIAASSFSGGIESEFGGTKSDGRLEATTGEGEGDIELESFSGEIVIRQR